jgi:hypothetical protein
MRKIVVIAIVLLTAATLGCSKKPQESVTEAKMPPASSSQEAAPTAPAPAPTQEAAPAAGMDMGKPASAPADNKAMPQDGAKNDGAAE